MHPPTPHQILGTILLLVLEVVPVIVYLLLEEVEGLTTESLADELHLHVVTSVELHEEPHGPQEVGLVVHLSFLPVESVLHHVHDVIVG